MSALAPDTPVKAPEPEAAIQPAECRLVLLEHIERLQAKLEARLTELEARAEELEAKDAELCEPEAGSPRTKETLRLLQRDLASVTKISNYVTPD
jgi:PHD finger protein 20